MPVIRKLKFLAKEYTDRGRKALTNKAYDALVSHPDIHKIEAVNDEDLHLYPKEGLHPYNLKYSLEDHLKKQGLELKWGGIQRTDNKGKEHHTGTSIYDNGNSYLKVSKAIDGGMPKHIYKKYDPNKYVKKVKGKIPAEAFKYPKSYFFKNLADKEHKELLAKQANNKKHLTPNELAAINKYSDSSRTLNEHLRDPENKIKTKQELLEHPNNPHDTYHEKHKSYEAADYGGPNDYTHAQIHHLDSALHKNVAHKHLTVFRGIPTAIADKLKIGHVVKKRAYTSTTNKAQIAADFGGGHVMHIKVPKSHPINYVPSSLENGHSHIKEHEVLLPRNTHMKITHKETVDGKHVIYATALRRKIKPHIEARVK